MMYVEGMQAIRANGKYQVLVDAHKQNTQIHRGSSFFFYHSYYVWEVETLSDVHVYTTPHALLIFM